MPGTGKFQVTRSKANWIARNYTIVLPYCENLHFESGNPVEGDDQYGIYSSVYTIITSAEEE